MHIPARITQLIVGFFLHTNNNTEQQELDDWVSQSMQNQLFFESCIENAARPVRPMDGEENEEDLRYIADLFMKRIKQIITPEETEILENWKQTTFLDQHTLKTLEESTTIEILYERIRLHFYTLNSN